MLIGFIVGAVGGFNIGFVVCGCYYSAFLVVLMVVVVQYYLIANYGHDSYSNYQHHYILIMTMMIKISFHYVYLIEMMVVAFEEAVDASYYDYYYADVVGVVALTQVYYKKLHPTSYIFIFILDLMTSIRGRIITSTKVHMSPHIHVIFCWLCKQIHSW